MAGQKTDQPADGGFIISRQVAHAFPAADGRSRFVAIEPTDFTIEEGQFVSLLGPSGCGKTTLLRILGGLIDPSHGEVRIAGERVDGPPATVSVVFQDFRLLPWRTVLSNVMFPVELQGMPKPERKERALRLIRMIGLEQFTEYYPHQLSGGMRQRVALARALMTEPSILLMDEPFGALDAQTREVMQIELLKLQESWSTTIVLVTHSVDEAVLLSDDVLVMSRSPGRLKERVAIGLPRPRWRDEVRSSREFTEYRTRIWDLIRPEIKV